MALFGSTHQDLLQWLIETDSCRDVENNRNILFQYLEVGGADAQSRIRDVSGDWNHFLDDFFICTFDSREDYGVGQFFHSPPRIMALFGSQQDVDVADGRTVTK